MAVNLEEYVPVVKYEGLNTTKDVTLAGTNTLSGATSFTGATNGVRNTPQIYLTEATTTLTSAESGKVVIATKASATQTFTLPAATVAGATFTFKAGHAGGEILVDPAGTDVIQAKATNDAGADVTPAGGTGIKNTAGTNVIGDYITLVADGVSKWYTVAQSGIWASQ